MPDTPLPGEPGDPTHPSTPDCPAPAIDFDAPFDGSAFEPTHFGTAAPAADPTPPVDPFASAPSEPTVNGPGSDPDGSVPPASSADPQPSATANDVWSTSSYDTSAGLDAATNPARRPSLSSDDPAWGAPSSDGIGSPSPQPGFPHPDPSTATPSPEIGSTPQTEDVSAAAAVSPPPSAPTPPPAPAGGVAGSTRDQRSGAVRWDDGPDDEGEADRRGDGASPPSARRAWWVVPAAVLGLICLGLGAWGLFGGGGNGGSDGGGDVPTTDGNNSLILPAGPGGDGEDPLDRWGASVATITAPTCQGTTSGAGIVLGDGRILTTTTIVGADTEVVVEGIARVLAATPETSAGRLVLLAPDGTPDAGAGWANTEAPGAGATLTGLFPDGDEVVAIDVEVDEVNGAQLLLSDSAPSGTPLFSAAGELTAIVLGRGSGGVVVASTHPALGDAVEATELELEPPDCPTSTTVATSATSPVEETETTVPGTSSGTPGDAAVGASFAALSAPDGMPSETWFGSAEFGAGALQEGDDPLLDALVADCRAEAVRCDFLFGASRPESGYQQIALDCGGRGPSFFSCAPLEDADPLPPEPPHAAGSCLVFRRDDSGLHFTIDCERLHDAEILNVSSFDGDLDSEEAVTAVADGAEGCAAEAGDRTHQVAALAQPDGSGNSILCLGLSATGAPRAGDGAAAPTTAPTNTSAQTSAVPGGGTPSTDQASTGADGAGNGSEGEAPSTTAVSQGEPPPPDDI